MIVHVSTADLPATDMAVLTLLMENISMVTVVEDVSTVDPAAMVMDVPILLTENMSIDGNLYRIRT